MLTAPVSWQEYRSARLVWTTKALQITQTARKSWRLLELIVAARLNKFRSLTSCCTSHPNTADSAFGLFCWWNHWLTWLAGLRIPIPHGVINESVKKCKNKQSETLFGLESSKMLLKYSLFDRADLRIARPKTWIYTREIVIPREVPITGIYWKSRRIIRSR